LKGWPIGTNLLVKAYSVAHLPNLIGEPTTSSKVRGAHTRASSVNCTLRDKLPTKAGRYFTVERGRNFRTSIFITSSTCVEAPAALPDRGTIAPVLTVSAFCQMS